MYDDDEDDDDVIALPVPTRRMHWLDVPILALSSASSFLDNLSDVLCAHANHGVRQRKFADEARQDIERIVSGE